MPGSKDHYESVLARVYSWMYGGFDVALSRNEAFFDGRGIMSPAGSARAVDLGAGCGFQSIPLARRGYSVTAIDSDRFLLDELEAHAVGLPIRTVQADLVSFTEHLEDEIELAVCMTDTLLHLESPADVSVLCADLYAALESGGRFVATIRDLTAEMDELDRFIPVRSDSQRIFTCFLEYEPETVKVHDLVYEKVDNTWELHRSFYRKLRLSPQWIVDELKRAGFRNCELTVQRGLATIVATKNKASEA